MAERTFQIKTPNGQIKEVSETLAKQLNRQVQVIGEVIDTRFKKRGKEKSISVENFRKNHIHFDIMPNGSKVRRIDPGYERVLEVDKDSKPGQAQYSGGAYRNRKVTEGGRVMSYDEWMRTR